MRLHVKYIKNILCRCSPPQVGPELEIPGYGCEDHFLEQARRPGLTFPASFHGSPAVSSLESDAVVLD